MESVNGDEVGVYSDGVNDRGHVSRAVHRASPSSLNVDVTHGASGQHTVSATGVTDTFCIRTGHTIESDGQGDGPTMARLRATRSGGAC